MAFEAPFRLEINHENNKLSFGPRRPNEVGRDILAVKVALGLVEIRNETEQELDQTSSPPVGTSAPLDKQGWFDCTTGEGISIAQASTYDSRLRKSLINYQIQNQFLIISYLIEKFGVREALGAVPRDLEFDQDNDNLPKEYSRSLIQQIESSVILFDSELGLLGEATLAVLHGWVPHSTITNSGYAHVGFDNYETIIDIIHTALANDLENENFGQSYDDMVNQGICVEGGFSRNEESKLNTYLEYASNEINWTRMVGEYNPFVTNREIQRFQFGILEFVKKDPLTTQSLLYSATIATLDNQLKDLDQEESISYAMSSEQRIENLKRMYFPDPFVDPDPFEIDDDRIGYFLETDFELKPGSLPSSDEETIQSLEQLALEEVFKYYQKPEIWFLNKSARPARDMPDNEIEKIQVTYFGGSTPPDSEHNGYYPFPVSLREKNNFDPDTEFSKYEAYSNLQYRLQFNKDQYRTRLKRWEITDIISGLLDGQEGAPNLYYELTGDVKTVSYRTSQDDEKELYERVIEEIEQKLAVWPEPNESKELFWVLSLKPNTSESYTQYWRDLENIGSTEPLIKFIEYRTPSLRPGQKYRALFYINKEKLDLIKDSVLLDTQRTSTRAPSVNTEEDDSCGDTSTQQNIRKYQEYKTHAIRTRNEIVKKFREETKKAKYQNDFDSMSIDLGDQQLAFNLNDAFNPFGGGMVSGKAYTEKVFSKLVGEDSSLLSAIGVVGSDTAQLDSIINSTDPLKVGSNNMPDGTEKEAEDNANKIRLTLEDLKVRVKIMSQDLKDAGKEIKKGGIKFAEGSAFNADREANYVNAFVSELEASMKEQGFKVSDEIVITFEFDRAVNNAKVGPKIGKSVIYLGLSIPMKVDPSETGRTKKSSTVSNKKETYDDTQMAHFRAPASKFKNLTRPRTVNYISRIFDMTTRYLPEGSIMKSFFEDSRGACKDLGIDIKKTLGVSYIGKYTSGLQLVPSKEQTNYEAVKEWWKTQATDPYNDWVNTSANNLRASDPSNPENDFFDESQALAMMGEMCEWEDVYKALFDKLDFASLLCDYIKCIKLPGFNIKLPSFYLPPLPKVPFIGWMGEVYKFLVENFKEIVNRLLCTAAKLLIDKMAIPFCEEQLREFISAGSSAGPLWNEAMADALLLTGITSGNAEQAKNFFEDSVAILTGDELCRLLKGERLDAATTRAIIKLVQNRGLEMELETAEDLSNFFGVLGAYLPTDLCEAIGNLPEIVAKDCEDSIDVLNDIRNKLLSDDPNISEEDLNAALEIAKKNRDDIANQLKSFSNSDLGDLAPSFFEMGNPSAMVSDYPPYLKQQMNDALSSVFEPARSSYISSLTNFIPAMRINMPEAPRPGDEDYDETTIMQLESALHQMSAFTYYSNLATARRYSSLGGYDEIEARLEANRVEYENFKSNYDDFVKDAGALKAKIKSLRSWMVNTCRNLGFVHANDALTRDWGDSDALAAQQAYIDKYVNLLQGRHSRQGSLYIGKYIYNEETSTVLRVKGGNADGEGIGPSSAAEFRNPAFRGQQDDLPEYTQYFYHRDDDGDDGRGCGEKAWYTEFLGCANDPRDNNGTGIKPGWGESSLKIKGTLGSNMVSFYQDPIPDMKKDGHNVYLVFPAFYRPSFLIHKYTGTVNNRVYHAPFYDLRNSDLQNGQNLQPYFFDLVPGFTQDPRRPGGLGRAQEYITNHYMPAIRSYIIKQKEINILMRRIILKYQDLIGDDIVFMYEQGSKFKMKALSENGLVLSKLASEYGISTAFHRPNVSTNLDRTLDYPNDRIKFEAGADGMANSETELQAPYPGAEMFFHILPEKLLERRGYDAPIEFISNLQTQLKNKLDGNDEGFYGPSGAEGADSLRRKIQISVEEMQPAPMTSSRAALLFACFQTETVRGHRVYKHARLVNQPPPTPSDLDDVPPVFLGQSSVFEGVINKEYQTVSIDDYLDNVQDPENNIQYGLLLRGFYDRESSRPVEDALEADDSTATQNLLLNLDLGLFSVKSFIRFVVNQFTDHRYLDMQEGRIGSYDRGLTDYSYEDLATIRRLTNPETKTSEFNKIVQELLEDSNVRTLVNTAITSSQGAIDILYRASDGVDAYTVLSATQNITNAIGAIVEHIFPARMPMLLDILSRADNSRRWNTFVNNALLVGGDDQDRAASYSQVARQTEQRKPYLSTTGILDWKYDPENIYLGYIPGSPQPQDKFNRTRVLAETRKFFVDNPLDGAPLNSKERQVKEDGGPDDGGRQEALNQLVSNRIQFLSAQVQDAISKLSNNTVEKHLPLIQELFSWQNEIYSGADGNFIGGSFTQNRLALQMRAGAYEPKIFIRDRAKSGNYDRYDIAIRGDFFLGQDPGEEIKFKYCDPLPEAQLAGKLELDSGEDFTKRDAWASFLYDKIATQLNSDSRAANLSTARKNELLRHFGHDAFMRSTIKVFEQVIFSLYRSRFFDVDYTNDLDDRISGNPIYFENCVSNKFGFSDASILSFDKVILGDPSVEIALEAARPENSPYQRDFDTPGPFEKAMKTIAVKAFIRVCLIEALLKGGIAYSSWDIESVITEPFFYDYMLNKIESELNNNSNLRGLWKPVMQKSESVSNPKEALRIFLNSELTKLPKYSKQIFNPNQPDRDFSNWALGDILPMVDTPWESTTSDEDGSKTYSFSFDDGRRGLPFCFRGQRSFHIEDYVHIRVSESVKTELDFLIASDGEPLGFWTGPATIEGFRRWFQEWLMRFNSINERAMSIEEKRSFLERVYAGLTIEHRARLMYLEVAFDDLEGTFESGEIKNPLWKFVSQTFGSRSRYDDQSRRKRGGFVYVKRGRNGRGTKQPAFTVDLARVSRDISPRVCPGLWQLRTGEEGPPGGGWNNLGFVLPGILQNLKEEETKDYMRNLLSENDDFKFVLENVFPIKRFMSVGSVYATSLLSGYSTVPDIMKSSKEAISAIARISDTPRRFQEEMFAMNQSSFQDFLKKNFPSDPSDPSCFEFPGLGKEFFEKFFSDLWELFKSLPAILLRGIALQIDPGYKEMRSHYLNCDIKHLRTNYLAGFTVDEKLINGLRLRPKSAKQKNKGKYASIMFSLPLDYYRSYTNPFKIHTRLYKTILKTISYIYSGNAPFIDLNSVFKIPCVDLDKNYLEGEKYDFGKYGRYGHPFSPFGLFALMTKELEMDKKMRRGKCKRDDPSIPCEDIEEETT